jgi:hypothetical protein
MPTHSGVKTQTAFCLAAVCCATRAAGIDIHLSSRTGPYTHWNRDGLVDDALEENSDYLMMIDSDLFFPAEGITTLLSRGKDVIGGFYMMRGLPPINTIKLDDGKGGYLGTKDWTPPPEPFPVAAVATGFLLVYMKVYKALERPWFPCVEPVGEDVAFCQNAIKAGFEVWCDPTFPIKHIGDYLY